MFVRGAITLPSEPFSALVTDFFHVSLFVVNKRTAWNLVVAVEPEGTVPILSKIYTCVKARTLTWGLSVSD